MDEIIAALWREDDVTRAESGQNNLVSGHAKH